MYDTMHAALRYSASPELDLNRIAVLDAQSSKALVLDSHASNAKRRLPIPPQGSPPAVAMPSGLLQRLDSLISNIEREVAEDYNLCDALPMILEQRREAAHTHVAQLAELRRIIFDGRTGAGPYAGSQSLKNEYLQLKQEHSELLELQDVQNSEHQESVKRLKASAKKARSVANHAEIAESMVATRLCNEEVEVQEARGKLTVNELRQMELEHRLESLEQGTSAASSSKEQGTSRASSSKDTSRSSVFYAARSSVVDAARTSVVDAELSNRRKSVKLDQQMQVVVLQAELQEFREAEADYASRHEYQNEMALSLQARHEQHLSEHEVLQNHVSELESKHRALQSEEARKMQQMEDELKMVHSLSDTHSKENFGHRKSIAMLQQQLTIASGTSDLHAQESIAHRDKVAEMLKKIAKFEAAEYAHIQEKDNLQKQVLELESGVIEQQRLLNQVAEFEAAEQFQNDKLQQQVLQLESSLRDNDMLMNKLAEFEAAEHSHIREKGKLQNQLLQFERDLSEHELLVHSKTEELRNVKAVAATAAEAQIQLSVVESELDVYRVETTRPGSQRGSTLELEEEVQHAIKEKENYFETISELQFEFRESRQRCNTEESESADLSRRVADMGKELQEAAASAESGLDEESNAFEIRKSDLEQQVLTLRGAVERHVQEHSSYQANVAKLTVLNDEERRRHDEVREELVAREKADKEHRFELEHEAHNHRSRKEEVERQLNEEIERQAKKHQDWQNELIMQLNSESQELQKLRNTLSSNPMHSSKSLLHTPLQNATSTTSRLDMKRHSAPCQQLAEQIPLLAVPAKRTSQMTEKLLSRDLGAVMPETVPRTSQSSNATDKSVTSLPGVTSRSNSLADTIHLVPHFQFQASDPLPRELVPPEATRITNQLSVGSSVADVEASQWPVQEDDRGTRSGGHADRSFQQQQSMSSGGSALCPSGSAGMIEATPSFVSEAAFIAGAQKQAADLPDSESEKSASHSDGASESAGVSKTSSDEEYDIIAFTIDKIDSCGWENMSWANGFTPLHWAAKHDRADLVGRLLAQRADPHQRDDTGRDAFDYAENNDAAVVLSKEQSGTGSCSMSVPSTPQNRGLSPEERASWPKLQPRSQGTPEVLLHPPRRYNTDEVTEDSTPIRLSSHSAEDRFRCMQDHNENDEYESSEEGVSNAEISDSASSETEESDHNRRASDFSI